MIRLQHGHYLSPVGARREAGAATLVETVYSEGMRLPRHRHEFPYLVLMVDGGMRERTCGRTHELSTGWVVFNEAGEIHENEIVSGRARCLNVELSDRFLGRMREIGLGPRDSVMYSDGGAAVGAIGRLYAAVLDPGPEVEVEEALVEVFGALARQARGVRAGKWVRAVVEMIQEMYPARPTLTELSERAGVQEVHLCRGFRKAMGCTIGEYVRRVRATRALSKIAEGEGLADAALGAGFADQSHMTRAFGREFGRSPGRMRAVVRDAG